MIEYVIQKLTKHEPDDLEAQCAAVAELADEIWHEHYTPIIGAEQVEYMVAKFQSAEQILMDIKENGFIYFTAREKGKDKLIGYCGVAPQEGCLLISKLYVHSDFRGNGISRSFLEKVFTLARLEYGLEKIRLTVNKYNENAIAVHQKNGFEIVESINVDIGGGFFMDDYLMELSLG